MSRRNPKFEWQTAFNGAQITGNAGFIALVMSTFDNGDGKGFFISGPKLSEMTGINVRTVREHINTLIKLGWIERTRIGGRRGGTTVASEYRLVIPDNQAKVGEEATRKKTPSWDGSEGGFQEGESDTQGDDPCAQVGPQGDVNTHPVDQLFLRPVSLRPSSLDLASLQPGDMISGEVYGGLEETDREHFVPNFGDSGEYVYHPKANPVSARWAKAEERLRSKNALLATS